MKNIKKFFKSNPKEATELAKKTMDVISNINVNETLNQFNKIAETQTERKRVNSEHREKMSTIENKHRENMTDLEKKHSKIDKLIEENSNIIKEGLKDNDLNKIHLGLSANVAYGVKIIDSLPNHNNSSSDLDNQKLESREDTKYIDII